MYSINFVTGETTFRTLRPQARSVAVIAQAENQTPLRLPMQLQGGQWEVKTALPSGWIFYSFEVDGHMDWDHDEGRLRSNTGRPCSLAMITNALTTHLHAYVH